MWGLGNFFQKIINMYTPLLGELEYLGFLIPKSLKSFLGSFHQALKHSKFSTYACPASSTKKCVNFLFVLNFPKMARVPHTTLKVFTLSWISLTSVVEYFFTWSDMLFDWYQEILTINRKKIQLNGVIHDLVLVVFLRCNFMKCKWKWNTLFIFSCQF